MWQQGDPWLLVAGGDNDPHLTRLIKAAGNRGWRVTAALTGQSGAPRLQWHLPEGRLLIDDIAIEPTAAFVREDVFHSDLGRDRDQAHKASVWYETIRGWLAAHPNIRWLSRASFGMGGKPSKLKNLKLAIESGFEIPHTIISNDADVLNDAARQGSWIHKPVMGGAHTQPFDGIESRSGVLAYPMKIQERLEPPEVRLFKVGAQHFAFNMVSDQLDYRTDSQTQIVETEVDPQLADSIDRLTAKLGLDFAAADLKSSASRQRLLFMEVNSNPMFAGFDQASRFGLCNAMLDWLGGTPK